VAAEEGEQLFQAGIHVLVQRQKKKTVDKDGDHSAK
jgi:hypothetical protein